MSQDGQWNCHASWDVTDSAMYKLTVLCITKTKDEEIWFQRTAYLVLLGIILISFANQRPVIQYSSAFPPDI